MAINLLWKWHKNQIQPFIKPWLNSNTWVQIQELDENQQKLMEIQLPGWNPQQRILIFFIKFLFCFNLISKIMATILYINKIIILVRQLWDILQQHYSQISGSCNLKKRITNCIQLMSLSVSAKYHFMQVKSSAYKKFSL